MFFNPKTKWIETQKPQFFKTKFHQAELLKILILAAFLGGCFHREEIIFHDEDTNEADTNTNELDTNELDTNELDTNELDTNEPDIDADISDPICGNREQEDGEECDDGNTERNDGCSSACIIEDNWTCFGSPSECEPICGDGVLLIEECDDAGTSSGDGCSWLCELEEGWICLGSPSECEPICGDGIFVSGEICDDQNLVNDDGCSASCALEEGWNCTGIPSNCSTTCEDNICVGEENAESCENDCPAVCGDNACTHVENYDSCKQDCPPEGFVRIPAGSFMMGSPDNESERFDDEGPQNEVTITRPFHMQIHEVTQDEWQTLMGNNPSHFSSSGEGDECGMNCPVEMVNWYEALAYANALSDENNLAPCFTINGTNVTINAATIYDCEGYRLPTEAEWEYAIRAETTTSFYNEEEIPVNIAWYGFNSNGTTHPVGEKDANSWGLYDMSGNVYEWCWDWYEEEYYNESLTNDPLGPNSGPGRVLRSGSWTDTESNTRSALRYNNDPETQLSFYGFRLVSSAL